MLRLDQLHFPARGNFSLEVAQGERVAIIGASGAGKSTLLQLIAGFLTPSSGTLSWQGQNLLTLPPAQRPINYLFQRDNLFHHLDVTTNVTLGIAPKLRFSGEELARAEAALEQVGLGGFGKRLPDSLSGGEQQRVALARVLVRERPLLLLDEPFAALDPQRRREMMQCVKQLCDEQQLTLLWVTHHPEEAALIAERFLFIDQGSVQESAPISELSADHPALGSYWRNDA